MMSLGNDFVSGPITAKGVSVAIRSYPKKLQKSRGARRCPSSSPKGSDGLGWAFHHGEGCCQGVAMCPDGHRRRSIIRALHTHKHTHTQRQSHAQTDTHTDDPLRLYLLYSCLHTCTHTNTHTHPHTCTHTHTHTHKRTHTHTNTHTHEWFSMALGGHTPQKAHLF